MKIKANDYKPNDVFKFIREGLNLTQKELSKKTNICVTSIVRYEKGMDNYTFETLMKIANAYDLEITISQKDKK